MIIIVYKNNWHSNGFFSWAKKVHFLQQNLTEIRCFDTLIGKTHHYNEDEFAEISYETYMSYYGPVMTHRESASPVQNIHFIMANSNYFLSIQLKISD